MSQAAAARNRVTGFIIGGTAIGLALGCYLFVESQRGPVRMLSSYVDPFTVENESAALKC